MKKFLGGVVGLSMFLGGLSFGQPTEQHSAYINLKEITDRIQAEPLKLVRIVDGDDYIDRPLNFNAKAALGGDDRLCILENSQIQIRMSYCDDHSLRNFESEGLVTPIAGDIAFKDNNLKTMAVSYYLEEPEYDSSRFVFYPRSLQRFNESIYVRWRLLQTLNDDDKRCEVGIPNKVVLNKSCQNHVEVNNAVLDRNSSFWSLYRQFTHNVIRQSYVIEDHCVQPRFPDVAIHCSSKYNEIK